MTDCCDEVVMQEEKSGFDSMMIGIGRLIRVVVRVRVKVFL